MSGIKVGDKVVAKVRGFPFWPAKVTNVSGKAVEVVFYGTGEKGKVNFQNVILYSEAKAISTKRHSLSIAVEELENDLTEEKSPAKESNPSRNAESTNKPKRKKGAKQSEDQPNAEATVPENSIHPSDLKNESNPSQIDSTIKPKKRKGFKQAEDKVNPEEPEAENVSALPSDAIKQDASQNVESTIKPKRKKGTKQADDQNDVAQGVENTVHPGDSENQDATVESTIKTKRRRGAKQDKNQHDSEAEKEEKTDFSNSKNQESDVPQNVELKTKRRRGAKQPNPEAQEGENLVHTTNSENPENVETVKSKRRKVMKPSEEQHDLEAVEAENADSGHTEAFQNVHSTIKPKIRKGIKQSDQPNSEAQEDVIKDSSDDQNESNIKTKRRRGGKQAEQNPEPLLAENVAHPIKNQDLNKPKRKRAIKPNSEMLGADVGAEDGPLVEEPQTSSEIEPRSRRSVTSLNGKTADKIVSKSDDDIFIVEEIKTQEAAEDELKIQVSESQNIAEASQKDGTKRSGRLNKPKKLIDENGPKQRSSEKNTSEIERTLMESNYALIEHFKFEDHEITKAITILNDLTKLKLTKEILKRQFHIVLTTKQLTMYYGKKSQQSRVLRNTATFVLDHLMKYFSNDEDPKETYLREVQEYQKSILSP